MYQDTLKTVFSYWWKYKILSIYTQVAQPVEMTLWKVLRIQGKSCSIWELLRYFCIIYFEVWGVPWQHIVQDNFCVTLGFSLKQYCPAVTHHVNLTLKWSYSLIIIICRIRKSSVDFTSITFWIKHISGLHWIDLKLFISILI